MPLTPKTIMMPEANVFSMASLYHQQYPNTTIKWAMISKYFSEVSGEAISSRFYGHSLKELMSEYEKEILLWAHKCYGSTRAMAKALGIDHSTIVRKSRKLGLTEEE